MSSIEQPKKPDERKMRIQTAAEILGQLIQDHRVREIPGEVILIDTVTALFVVGVGEGAVQNLLQKRADRGLSVDHEAKRYFVSLPLEAARLNNMLEDMGIVREAVAKTVNPDVKTK